MDEVVRAKRILPANSVKTLSSMSYTAHPEARWPHAIAIRRRNEAPLRRRDARVAVAPGRKALVEDSGMPELHGAGRPQNFELMIERQEGLQQVLFRPKP